MHNICAVKCRAKLNVNDHYQLDFHKVGFNAVHLNQI